MAAEIAKMNEVFSKFSSDFITKMQRENEITESNAARLKHMFEYNCIGGKVFRGVQVITYAKNVCALKNKSFEEVEEATYALAWAVEVLQACFLVADDMMDGSQTRRGQPCWYKLPTVQNDAVNDALILESFMNFLVTEYLPKSLDVLFIVKLFQDVCLKTQIGQMTDLLSQPQGRKGLEVLNSFDISVYKRIVKYKTAFYTFYLPMAAGFALAGVTDSTTLDAVRDICVEIGEKFQIQDDYLDCYGAPEKIGKIGTDIQDHKCSWLVVQALERVTPAQRAVLEANYGHEGEENIAAIKALYNELDMPSIYKAQEEASLARIEALLAKHKDVVEPSLFEAIIARVHGREK